MAKKQGGTTHPAKKQTPSAHRETKHKEVGNGWGLEPETREARTVLLSSSPDGPLCPSSSPGREVDANPPRMLDVSPHPTVLSFVPRSLFTCWRSWFLSLVLFVSTGGDGVASPESLWPLSGVPAWRPRNRLAVSTPPSTPSGAAMVGRAQNPRLAAP
ncbi:hypothetical protein GW17_00021659 [Ensete ventricosum]|nr:hypothetical protein GW17_00021659 [Ensete ventricosum]